MFEFYEMITDTQTKEETIEKRQYEETPDVSELKQKLENEISQYERYEKVSLDRWHYYIHNDLSYPISLSDAVFKEEKFVGCILKDGVFAPVGKFIKGEIEYDIPEAAYSRQIDVTIRKKAD